MLSKLTGVLLKRNNRVKRREAEGRPSDPDSAGSIFPSFHGLGGEAAIHFNQGLHMNKSIAIGLLLGLALPALADCRLGIGAGTLVDQWTATPDSQTQELISAVGVPAFCARSAAGPLWPCTVTTYLYLWEWYSTQNSWIVIATNDEFSESIDCKQSINYLGHQDWGQVEIGDYQVEARIFDTTAGMDPGRLMSQANDYFTITRY